MKYISFKTGICLAIIGMMFILFEYYTPWLVDDYSFAKNYIGFNNGSSSFSLSALCRQADFTREEDNGRLANILAPISTLMIPHRLFALVAGSLCAVLIYLIARCASISSHRMVPVVCGTALASLVCLPWRDSIFVADFWLNYVLSSVLVLTALLVLWRVSYRNIFRPFALFSAGMFAFVAAWMHEGFSIPVCVGLGLYVLIRRFRLPWQWYVITAFFIIGSLWVVTAPGILERANNTINEDSEISIIKRVLLITPLLLPMLVIFGSIYINSRGRRKLRVLFCRSQIAIYVGTAITSVVIAIFINPWLRAAWPAEMFMIIIVLMLGKDVLRQISDKMVCWLSVSSLILFVTVMGYALSWQKKLYEENEQIIPAMETGNGTVYRDLVVDNMNRRSVLYLPSDESYIIKNQYEVLTYWFDGKVCAVVPAEMAEFDAAELVPVDSTVSRWQAHLIAPYNSETCAADTVINGDRYLRVNFTDPQGVLRSYLRKI